MFEKHVLKFRHLIYFNHTSGREHNTQPQNANTLPMRARAHNKTGKVNIKQNEKQLNKTKINEKMFGKHVLIFKRLS